MRQMSEWDCDAAMPHARESAQTRSALADYSIRRRINALQFYNSEKNVLPPSALSDI